MSQRDRSLYDVAVGRHISCVMLLALVGIAPAPAQSPSAPPAMEVIVEGMARARADNRARLRSYVVTRDYALFGKEKNKTTSEVTAQLTFVPPNSKKYDILQRSGSGLGERLVRRMLDGETAIVKEYSATDISPDNYDFRLSGEESVSGRRCYVIGIVPKRAAKTLLHGTIWVDANTYLLHRMEGAPAQSPSWWLTDARITFFYSDVEGMWLQTASEFTTHVRIFGKHTMISRDVKYETAALTAATNR
ncbi:MAG: sigma-E factor regulatory protein RseB domain-containing protein [Bryobacterales bacterium]